MRMFKACKSGWTYFAHTNKCYKYISSMLTFQKARNYCKSQAPSGFTGDSVQIKDKPTDDFMKTLTKKIIWTSGNKLRNGKWVWGDGTPFRYTNWGVNQPDNNSGMER